MNKHRNNSSSAWLYNIIDKYIDGVDDKKQYIARIKYRVKNENWFKLLLVAPESMYHEIAKHYKDDSRIQADMERALINWKNSGYEPIYLEPSIIITMPKSVSQDIIDASPRTNDNGRSSFIWPMPSPSSPAPHSSEAPEGKTIKVTNIEYEYDDDTNMVIPKPPGVLSWVKEKSVFGRQVVIFRVTGGMSIICSLGAIGEFDLVDDKHNNRLIVKDKPIVTNLCLYR